MGKVKKIYVSIERKCKPVADCLERSSITKVLERIGHFAIVFAVIFWLAECDDRKIAKEDQRKAKHHQAWQAINTAQGSTSNGGRIEALQDLANDNISLAGVDLSNAYLSRISLKKGSSLYEANLTGANLFEANLDGVYLADATLCKAFLANATLKGAQLKGAELEGASLTRAVLTDVNLEKANLRNADLYEIVDWRKIKSIQSANIFGVKYPPAGFERWAKEHGAVSFQSDDEWKSYIKKQKTFLKTNKTYGNKEFRTDQDSLH